MDRSAYSLVSASLFALFAVGHIVRAAQSLSFQVGATSIPVWVSWVIAVIAAGLSVWGFRSRG